MQFNIVKAHQIPERMDMHLADALGIVAGFGKFTRHRVRIAESNEILLADAPVFFL